MSAFLPFTHDLPFAFRSEQGILAQPDPNRSVEADNLFLVSGCFPATSGTPIDPCSAEESDSCRFFRASRQPQAAAIKLLIDNSLPRSQRICARGLAFPTRHGSFSMGLAQPGGCFAGLMVSPKDFASSVPPADEAFCLSIVPLARARLRRV